jgi:hypothetical protein
VPERQLIWRILPRFVAAAFLILVSALGGYSGIDELRRGAPESVLQHSVSIGSVIYGILGIIAGAGVLFARRWGYVVSIVWGVVITYTGGMAAHAYGETAALATALAFLMTAIIAGIVTWLANIGTRNS